VWVGFGGGFCGWGCGCVSSCAVWCGVWRVARLVACSGVTCSVVWLAMCGCNGERAGDRHDIQRVVRTLEAATEGSGMWCKPSKGGGTAPHLLRDRAGVPTTSPARRAAGGVSWVAGTTSCRRCLTSTRCCSKSAKHTYHRNHAFPQSTIANAWVAAGSAAPDAPAAPPTQAQA
jgi:hypothetical protein